MHNRNLKLFWLYSLLIFSFLPLPVSADDPFGQITNPLPAGGGLIPLLNNILRLVFVIAGIYAFVQIIVAGLGFISAGGDAKKIETAWNGIWQSLLGVVIIISSIAMAALMGLLLFKDPTAILSPKVYGPN